MLQFGSSGNKSRPQLRTAAGWEIGRVKSFFREVWGGIERGTVRFVGLRMHRLVFFFFVIFKSTNKKVSFFVWGLEGLVTGRKNRTGGSSPSPSSFEFPPPSFVLGGGDEAEHRI